MSYNNLMAIKWSISVLRLNLIDHVQYLMFRMY